MNLKDIKELIDTLIEKDIAEFELEHGKERIRIRRGSNGVPAFTFASMAAPMPVTVPASALPGPLSPAAAPPAEARAAEELHIVKSPIVGTFYECPSPGTPAFVQVGDAVESGQVLCIIEAMKLMNEIESDISGVIEKRFVSNQQPVEYGEALFGIRKK